MKTFKLFLVATLLIFSTTLSFGQFCDQAQGSPGFPSNTTCQTAICGADPYCCSTMWDAICASAAATSPSCTGCLSVGGGPCGSILNIGGCGQSVNTTMSGAGSWDITACGFNTPGVESMFSYTATSTGVYSIDVTSATGGFVDFFWKVASGGCNNTGWNCIGDIFTPGNYGAMNWTAGVTYYLLLDPEGTGAYDFTFDLVCPVGAPVTASDCNTAYSICTDVAFQIDPSGYGAIDELCTGCTTNPSTNPGSANAGCLLGGENNSTWFLVNVLTAGTLEFSFGASGVNTNYYDWIMWQYDASTCAAIAANTIAPIRCNWNGTGAGFTGIGTPVPGGGSALNFEPEVIAASNSQYLICFSNWSSAVSSLPLNFFGTAGISCTPLYVEIIDFYGVQHEGYNELNWTTGAEYNNSHFGIERSLDGENYSLIGELTGNGTTLESSSYRFNDYSPGNSATYYRLKQYDFDGTMDFSNIIVIAQSGNKEFKVVNAFPNPASDLFTIQLISPEEDNASVQIRNTSGRTVSKLSHPLVEGINEIDLNVDKLSKGLYLISIKNEKSQSLEVIKLNIQ
jgi:hypothetical protein